MVKKQGLKRPALAAGFDNFINFMLCNSKRVSVSKIKNVDHLYVQLHTKASTIHWGRGGGEKIKRPNIIIIKKKTY